MTLESSWSSSAAPGICRGTFAERGTLSSSGMSCTGWSSISLSRGLGPYCAAGLRVAKSKRFLWARPASHSRRLAEVGPTRACPGACATALIFGLPDLSASDQAKLDRGNLLAARAGQVWNLASKFGIPVGEENPGSSWLWHFPDRIRRRASPCFHEAIVDQCAAGRPFRARTRFQFLHCRPSPALLKMKCHGRGLCDFTHQPHLELSGKEKGAVQFRTRQKAAYPDAICAQLAAMFSQVIVNRAVSRKWMLLHG